MLLEHCRLITISFHIHFISFASKYVQTFLKIEFCFYKLFPSDFFSQTMVYIRVARGRGPAGQSPPPPFSKLSPSPSPAKIPVPPAGVPVPGHFFIFAYKVQKFFEILTVFKKCEFFWKNPYSKVKFMALWQFFKMFIGVWTKIFKWYSSDALFMIKLHIIFALWFFVAVPYLKSKDEQFVVSLEKLVKFTYFSFYFKIRTPRIGIIFHHINNFNNY